jgi:hypothetical protein
LNTSAATIITITIFVKNATQLDPNSIGEIKISPPCHYAYNDRGIGLGGHKLCWNGAPHFIF